MLTAADLLAELRRVVDESGPEITLYRFRNETGISRHIVYDRWGNWTNLRLAAGLPKRNKPVPVYTDDELLAAFNDAARRSSFYPKQKEFDQLSDRCWQTLDRRFGKRREIIRLHRSWLEKQPEDLKPSFLVGCPPECDPTPIPGIHIFREPTLDLRAMCEVLTWLPATLKEIHATRPQRVAALQEYAREQLRKSPDPKLRASADAPLTQTERC